MKKEKTNPKIKRLLRAVEAAEDLLCHLTGDNCNKDDLRILQRLVNARKAVQS